jgi:sulfatase maturation enzyme AslB (radical SAM superfamily)
MNELQLIIIEGDRGDPVMHPNLKNLLIHLSSAPSNPTVELTTNGSIQSPHWWAELAKIPNLVVRFSIDGSKNTNHLYRVGIDFDRIIKNVTAFTSAGGRAIMKTMIFQHNENEIEELVNLSRNLGVASIHFTSPHISRFQGQPNWPVWNKGKIIHTISPSYLNEAWVVAQSVQHYHIDDYRTHNFPKRNIIESTCPNLQARHIYVTYQQHVIPCCMLHYEVYGKSSPAKRFQKLVGNMDSIDLSKNSLSSILSNDFFSRKLEEHFYAGPHLPTCVNSCKSQILPIIKLKNNNNYTT